jgi:flagellar basal body-associated protein FliL
VDVKQTYLLVLLLVLLIFMMVGLIAALFLLQKKKPAPQGPKTRKEAEQKIWALRKKIREEKEKAEQETKKKPIDVGDLTAAIRIWLALDRINEKLAKQEKNKPTSPPPQK